MSLVIDDMNRLLCINCYLYLIIVIYIWSV